jgi:lysophospholipase L1-like esterase
MEQDNKSTRRNFLKATSLASVAFSMPHLVNAAYKEEKIKHRIQLSEGDRILFQGDSITDAGRKKEDESANTAVGLGTGYAVLTAAQLLDRYANEKLTVYNRGIAGNKVFQLAERWDKDALQLKPSVISVLVGVNDYWHTFLNGYTGTVKTYGDDLRKLLTKTKEALPDVKFIIGEPFAINGVKAVTDSWFPAFYDYQKAAREIAKEYKAVFIPYQSIFDKALKVAPGSYWTRDGVHPTLAGANLMASAWLQAVKA